MKRIILLLIFAVMLRASGAFAAKPIKIGCIDSLTGDLATYGIASVNMARLAVNDINKNGGILDRKIELIAYDTKSNGKDAIKAVLRMIEKDKVCAIIGSNASSINIATAPVVNEKKIPQIATLATNTFVTVDANGKVRPYSFRICYTDPYQGMLAASFAYGDLRKKKAAVLYNIGSDYAVQLTQCFTDRYEMLGGTITAKETFRAGEYNFRTQLEKIKQSGAELLFLPGMGKDMAEAVKQTKRLGLKLAILGGDGYSDFMIDEVGAAMKGTYWISHTYRDDPSVKKLLEHYKEAYKADCREFINAVMTHDTMIWLADAIKRAGKAEGEAIAKALAETKNLALTHAYLTIDPKTHDPFGKEGIILKVGDNMKTTLYKKITLTSE
ncbi:MAG: ABC transporter substrate-binding protein [Synergistes sp.]|nr:ABC transporter substrate-binding protein [Synergistes sp.]